MLTLRFSLSFSLFLRVSVHVFSVSLYNSGHKWGSVSAVMHANRYVLAWRPEAEQTLQKGNVWGGIFPLYLFHFFFFWLGGGIVHCVFQAWFSHSASFKCVRQPTVCPYHLKAFPPAFPMYPSFFFFLPEALSTLGAFSATQYSIEIVAVLHWPAKAKICCFVCLFVCLIVHPLHWVLDKGHNLRLEPCVWKRERKRD